MRSIFSLALLLPAVLALPSLKARESFVKMPIAGRLNTANLRSIVETDRARAQLFMQKAQEKAEKVTAGTLFADVVVSVPLTNGAVDYTASIGVGTPATQYNVIIDTGSANTWVGSGKEFISTSSTKSTGQNVSVTYGSGSFNGVEVLDSITLGPGIVITDQSLGVASQSTGFVGVDGILGLGSSDLTINTLSPDIFNEIPTVVENLYGQGTISDFFISISFEPTTSDSVKNGEITFGNTDSSKFTGPITFTPITSASPANEFWGIDQSIKFGTANIMSTTAGIVDTGTTLILIASDAFQKYLTETQGVLDAETGLVRLSTSQFNKLQNLDFNIGGTTFSLTPNGQAWPRVLNSLIGGNSDDVYLIVADLGTPSGGGFDFITGQAFFERFYAVLDSANSRVGFAPTAFTNATTN